MPIIMQPDSAPSQNSADQDYFLDAEGNLTTDTEAAATLLIRKGQNVSKEVADKYGIGKASTPTEDETAEKAEAPSANKSQKPAKNKGA